MRKIVCQNWYKYGEKRFIEKMKKYYNLYQTKGSYNIHDFYKNPSEQKLKIWKNIQSETGLPTFDHRIISANMQQFTVGAHAITSEGTHWFMVFTKDYTYAINIKDLRY